MNDTRTPGQRRSRHNIERLSLLEDWQLEDRRHDLRGQTLHGPDGRALGPIRDMLVDTEHKRVAALRLDDGDTIDIDDVDIRDGRAVLIDSAPAIGAEDRLVPPARVPDRSDHRAGLHGGDAGVPMARAAGGDAEERLPIVQEELAIDKRMTDLGNVRVRTRVVEQPVQQEVTLQRERVDIERRAAGRALSASEADALLRDTVVEVTERGEEAVVSKTARVVEEVVVRKAVERHTQRIEDKVRRTEVDVDRDGQPGRRDDPAR